MDQATREAVSVSVEQAIRPLIAPALSLLESQGQPCESVYTNRTARVVRHNGIGIIQSSGSDGEELYFRHFASEDTLVIEWSSPTYKGAFRLRNHSLLTFDEQAPWFVSIKKALAD